MPKGVFHRSSPVTHAAYGILEQFPAGIFSCRMAGDAGVQEWALRRLEKWGYIRKLSFGIYVLSTVREIDNYFLLQLKYPGIFSLHTALFLLGCIPEEPPIPQMTFREGFHSASFKRENAIVTKTSEEWFDFGVVEVTTPLGNTVKAYGMYRSLCDIIRLKRISPDEGLRIFSSLQQKGLINYEELTYYATILRCETRLSRILATVDRNTA